VLKARGYRTTNVGKWHLSGNDTKDTNDGMGGLHFKTPHERGFDKFVGITRKRSTAHLLTVRFRAAV